MMDEYITVLSAYDPKRADEISAKAHRERTGHSPAGPTSAEDIVEALYEHDELTAAAAERELLGDPEAEAEERYFNRLPGGDMHAEVRGWNDNEPYEDDERA